MRLVTRYTLDSNIIINLNRTYPRELFPSLWEALEDLAVKGSICVCEEVFHEIESGGDALARWIEDRGIICPLSQAESDRATEISQRYPGWVQGRTNGADPYIVAHSLIEGSVIVTNERRAGNGVADSNQKIPNVADTYGQTTLDFLSFLRTLRWVF